MKKLNTICIALLLTACSTPATEATPEAAPEAADKHEALVAAATACDADPECAENLKSCDVVKAIECSALIAATVAACAVGPEDPACEAALLADKASGCCDCVPKGVLRTACEVLPTKDAPAAEEVKVDKPAKK